MQDNFLWVEDYRPATIKDCILPDSIKKSLNEYVKAKEVPNLMFFGGPGCGKTTAAKALCEEVGCDYIMINGSEERGIDTLRTKIKAYASSMSFFGGRKVIIIDEADYLTAESQAAFRGIIEEFSKNCSFIFTCNTKARIIEAIHSRCAAYDFRLKKGDKPKMAKAFLDRLITILKAEKVEFNEDVVLEIIVKYFPDYRRTINELQKHAASGPIDVGLLGQIAGDANIKDLIKALSEKDFTGMRKWVVNNLDSDSTAIYRTIFDSLYEVMEASSIPQAVLTIADYQYKAVFCADQEICLCACLTDLMGNCDFK